MIYLDTCILIYAVEGQNARGELVRARLQEMRDTLFAVSPLVRLECLVTPLRGADIELADRYEQVLDLFVEVPLDRAAFDRAAELRAAHGLRTPDALHLAAAQLSGCAELWTNDARLTKASRGLAVNVVA